MLSMRSSIEVESGEFKIESSSASTGSDESNRESVACPLASAIKSKRENMVQANLSVSLALLRIVRDTLGSNCFFVAAVDSSRGSFRAVAD